MNKETKSEKTQGNGDLAVISARLSNALKHPLWQSHKIGDTYLMDGRGNWKIAYYPIFEDSVSGEPYSEPRALVEKPAIFKGKTGTDFREVPLRYLERNVR